MDIIRVNSKNLYTHLSLPVYKKPETFMYFGYEVVLPFYIGDSVFIHIDSTGLIIVSKQEPVWDESYEMYRIDCDKKDWYIAGEFNLLELTDDSEIYITKNSLVEVKL